MKTTTNTTSTTNTQLVAVHVCRFDENANDTLGHAFINGVRFDNISGNELFEFLNMLYPKTNYQLLNRSEWMNNGVIHDFYAVDELAPIAPIVEANVVNDYTPKPFEHTPITVVRASQHVPSSIAVNPHDARMMHRLDADILASRYGVNRIKQRAMFTVGNDKDAERAYIYRAIDSGAPYVLYHGELLAIPESAIMPNNGPVMVSHVEPKQDAPKQDAPKRRHDWVVFRYGGNVYARKLNRNGDKLTVNHDRQVWPLDMLDCVSRHYTKDAAQKRVKQERKNAKRADKLTTKTEAPKNGNGCKHIPETYKGLVVDVQNGNMADIDRKAAWRDVAALVDELVAADIALDCITYERSYAWVIPSDRSDEFARANHTVVSMTTKRGHSLKDKRRAWFVKCTK